MIVLDTNVLSALMQRPADATVVAWLDARPRESIWTTAITVFEVRFGIERLASGRKRRALEEALGLALSEDLEGRILAFDAPAAQAAGVIAARRQRAGQTVDVRDTQIAGIILDRRATLATRNVRHFEGLSLSIVDPWSGAR